MPPGAALLRAPRLSLAACFLFTVSALSAQDGVYVTLLNSSTNEYITDQAQNPKTTVWQNTVPLKAPAQALWAGAVDERRAHWLKIDLPSGTYFRNRYTGRMLKCTATAPFTVGLQDNTPISLLFQWQLTNAGATNTYWITSKNSNAGTLRLVPMSQTLATATAGDTTDQKWIIQSIPIGASVPWIRYTHYDHAFAKSPSTNILAFQAANPLTTEAADETTLDLASTSAWVEWTVEKDAGGMVIRFSVPDAASGGGLTSTLEILRDGTLVKTVTLDSKYAHLYGPEQAESNNPADGNQRRVYDEQRVPITFTAGQVVRLRRASSATNRIYLNFIELEPVPAARGTPSGPVLNVTASPYFADNTGVADALTPIKNALASAAGKTVYLPAGTYRVTSGLKIPDGTTIAGDGPWHTTVWFDFQTPSDTTTKGGFIGNGTYIIRDLHMTGSSTYRDNGQSAFNALVGTTNGTNSVIDNLWWEHMTVGRFITAENLQVRNCRARNNFADGIVAMKANNGFIVDNCHVRSAGDDGLACWSAAAPMNENNIFRYNTVEFNHRASAIGLFGGKRHLVHHNLVADTCPSAQSDLRLTSDFDGPGFSPASASDPIEIYDNIFSDCRSSYGSIFFSAYYYPVQNILIRNASITSSQSPLIYVRERSGAISRVTTDITLKDMTVTHASGSNDAGLYLEAASTASGTIALQNVDRTGGGSPGVQRAGTNPVNVTNDAASSGW